MKKRIALVLTLACGLLAGYALPGIFLGPESVGASPSGNCRQGLCHVFTSMPSVLVSVDDDYKSKCKLTVSRLNSYTVEIVLRAR